MDISLLPLTILITNKKTGLLKILWVITF